MVNPCVFRSVGETRTTMNGKPFWAKKKRFKLVHENFNILPSLSLSKFYGWWYSP
jgi:hypothetical protein